MQTELENSIGRRLEDRIRVLCDAAITCSDSHRLHAIVEELREALREHVHRFRTLAEAKLVVGLPLEERRNQERETVDQKSPAA